MRRLQLGMLVSALVLMSALPAAALFGSGRRIQDNTFSTATLGSPTELTSTVTCDELLIATVDLSWTMSTSSFADGYDIYRGTNDGGPYEWISHVDGRTATTVRDDGLSVAILDGDRFFYYVARATSGNWVSDLSRQTMVEIPLVCVPVGA